MNTLASVSKNSFATLQRTSVPAFLTVCSSSSSSNSASHGRANSNGNNNGQGVEVKNSSNNTQQSQQQQKESRLGKWGENHTHRGLRHNHDNFWKNWKIRHFGAPWESGFREFDRRFFDDMFETPDQLTVPRNTEVFDWSPTADMISTKDGYEITAELPGVSKENIKIEVGDDIITLKGEKKAESSREAEGQHYKERSYGSFIRRFSLPDGVDPKLVKAEFKDGVLRMHLPKGAKPEAHTIKIE